MYDDTHALSYVTVNDFLEAGRTGNVQTIDGVGFMGETSVVCDIVLGVIRSCETYTNIYVKVEYI